ncbi:MAG: glutamine synthetase adenylyltransferase [Planctomycetaceae bacterium]|nr:glutamine synthetase adenylyltransferase [Planctomycetaceae bacterium]
MFPDFFAVPVREAVLIEELRGFGFQSPELACSSLQRILGWWKTAEGAEAAAEAPLWFLILQRVLREAPLKDTVLSVVERFVQNTRDDLDPFLLFEQSPRSLDILARLACGSPFLTQTLLSDPSCLMSLTLHGRAADTKDREQFIEEATNVTLTRRTRREKLAELRRYQRRQLLRIGMCDAFGLMDLKFITLQLSLLADSMVQCCLNLAADDCGVPANRLTVLALGKLGGEELNYSSDIDLALIAAEDSADVQRLARLTIDGLTDNIAPGFLYRVDLRLRPWGEAGPLVSTVKSYASYIIQDAALWEKQALLKARVIAGAPSPGQQFLTEVRPLLFTGTAVQVRASINDMKARIEQRLRQRGKLYSEVKLGAGSIRDVEFLVQSLQLIHGEAEPRILCANTLDSLVRLAEFGLINASWYRQLRAGYVFLRTVEHSLQLLHNQQTHELPADHHQLEWLANRLDYPDAATLMHRYEEHRQAVRTIFEECLQGEQRAVVTHRAADLPAVVDPSHDELSAARSPEQLKRHRELVREMLRDLDQGSTCRVRVEDQLDADTWNLLIAGHDFSGWLSAICGLLSIYHLDIRSGDAITGEGQNGFGDNGVAGRFIACVSVRATRLAVEEGTELALCPEHLASQLEKELARLGHDSRTGRIEEVRAELISRFCAAVPSQAMTGPRLDVSDVNIELAPVPNSVLTKVDITGSDSWGFLYELASALSLSRFRVLRAIIRGDDQRVSDVLYVRERNGRPIDSEERRQELKLAATLIKQFTHWLPSASDPHLALVRFRELVSRLQPATAWARNMQSLQRPGVLHAVARVLGISQYLWETFLRSRHQELFPLLVNADELALRDCRDSLRLELDQLVDGATGAAAWTALNEFKDRHLFRIDMRHVLGHCRPFGAFSEELTELAELVVSKSLELAWLQEQQQWGIPLESDGRTPARWMVGALGKFGGVEMGFASDLELILVYSDSGRTNGPTSVSTSEFFDRMMNAVATGIVAPQDGIFHVDLRMRPYGQAGAAAVRLDDFRNYYRADGPAWPYERQALVRLRPVAGDREFGDRVLSAAADCTYMSGSFDFVSMRAMRERQVRQLVRGGSINAKLSDGGLVDFEYAIQALQISFGRQYPTLRHSNTLRVLQEATRLKLISEKQCHELERTYVFLRELIDCLRMARGNAKDLTLPAAGTRDWEQLSRRMQSIHDSEIPLESLESQMHQVREFSRQIEEMCRQKTV